MPSIDERIVSMAFENTVFEQRVSQTMTTLTKLDTAIKNVGSGPSGLENIEKAANKVTLEGPMSALDKLKAKLGRSGEDAAQGMSEIERASNKVTLEGASRSVDKLQGKMDGLNAGSTFTDIEKASDRVTLSGLVKALDGVTSKFSVLEGAASVALGNITSTAAMKGGAFAKSFAFGPVQQGLDEYQTKLGSIQTILANTEGQQVTGTKNVKKYLGELNAYSDKTIYNFGQMARNIGTFTAAGVDLPKSVQSIKGIANLAALSGSNSQQASTAMYQLSQAIAAGRVGLQDWNSVVNAGMGGAVFQKSLMRTAENMGALEKGAVKIDKATGKATVRGQSFRESIMMKPGETSWLTSEVLTETLGQLTGDMTDAQLAAKGFSAEQIKAIQAQAKNAENAATQVKTLPQVFEVARESIGSGWAESFELIFGDIDEAKKTFTDLSNFINGYIKKVSDARNKILGEWKKLGGRTQLIEGIKAAFDALMGVITPIKDAFREIFPPKTGKDLFEMTKNFRELMEGLKPSPETVDKLKRIFTGFFAVVEIGWTVVKELAGAVGDLLGAAGKGSGGFLEFVAGIGDWLVKVNEALVQGGGLKRFFEAFGEVLKVPIRLLGSVAGIIGGLFSGADTNKIEGVGNSIKGVGEALGPLETVVKRVKDAWAKLIDIVGEVKTALDPWFSDMASKLSGIGDVIADAFKGLNFENIMQGLQVGLIGGIFLTLKKALGGGGKGLLGPIKDTLGSVNTMLGGFTKQMEAMQTKLKAEALLAIAAAVAILAAGIYVLSTIPADKLAKAMTATAIGLGQLMGAMKILMAGGGKLGAAQLPLIAAGMIGIALAVVILAGAMKIFATMKPEDIGKGMAGISGSLGAVAVAMKLMGGGPGLMLQAAGLILLGVALNAIAASMKIFATIKWEDMAKGLIGVGGSIAGLGLAMSLVPPTLPLTAAGMILLSIALNAIALAVGLMGRMQPETILKGLLGIGGALAIIALAMVAMPPTLPLTAAGLLLVAAALPGIAAAIALMGNLNLGTLVKGIAALGATLVVLAVGLTAMIVALPGAAALLVASAALAVLVPVLGILGTMKWSAIFKGLGAIALAMITVGVAGLVAAPGLIAIGVALVPLGLGLMMVALAAKLFASAVKVLSAEGQKGFSILLAAVTAFIALLPKLIISLVKDLVGVLDEIVKLAPRLVEGLAKVLTIVIKFIIDQAPKLAEAIGALVTAISTVLTRDAPKLIQAGMTLLQNILSGLSQNIGSVVTKVAEIITKFLNALSAKAPQLVAAGAKTLVSFVQGIGSKTGQVVSAVANMATKFIAALTKEIPRIITSGQNLMLKLLGAIGGFIPKLIRKGTDIIISILDGIEDSIPKIRAKAVRVATVFLNNLATGLVGLADAGFDALIDFLHGIERSIRENMPELMDAGAGIADAIKDGIVDRLGKLGGLLRGAINAAFSLLPKAARKLLGIGSPSRVFGEIGGFTVMGFVQGMKEKAKDPIEAMRQVTSGLISELNAMGGGLAPSAITKKIGKEIAGGFAKGLLGSEADIKGAFGELRGQLSDEIKTAREQLKTDQDALDAELAKSKGEQDPKLIADLSAAVKQGTRDIASMTAARRFLNQGLKDEKNQMIALSNSYDKISAKLKKAQADLKQLVADRKAKITELTGKYSTLPDLDEKTTVEEYKQKLRDKIAANVKYNATLQALKAAGIDDTTYQMLLEEGTAGQEFADQLLAGGPAAISEINSLDTDLKGSATTLATNAADNMYNAGIETAQGFVKGLKKKKSDLRKQMEDLAEAMIRALKKKLKIKSPSEVFSEMGKLMTEGLSRGLEKDTSKVEVAAKNLGTGALSAMSDAIANNIDVDPVISPILDLARVKDEARKMDAMMPTPTVTAGTAFDQAGRISDLQAALAMEAISAEQVPTTRITFEQNNYSPEALSNIEIYRQTNNQMARLKSLVGVS